MLTFVISFTFIIGLLAYAFFSLAHFQKLLPFTASSNILILTAHPDDECMFFGPTITSLRTLSKSKMHVLCLSTGNADGLGSIRKKELVKSCQTFGIPNNNVKSLDNADLQDGMQNQWDPELVAKVINEYVVKQKINTIITFDDGGVSGHANHIAAYKGARHYVDTVDTKIKLYKLESIPLYRKYIGIFDLLTPSSQNNDHTRQVLISPPFAYLTTHKAMRQHTSQLVWFRWLYVTFSRYMFINDLTLDNPTEQEVVDTKAQEEEQATISRSIMFMNNLIRNSKKDL